jgi:hypothetical protein
MKDIIIKILLSAIFIMSCEVISKESVQVQKNKKASLTVTGEHVLADGNTLEQAYAVAEKLAKAKAVKRIGEYFETISVTDSTTNKFNRFDASVSAAVLKYTVTNKQKKLVNNEIIVEVTIKASHEPAKLNKAIERYYSNEKSKNELHQINLKLKKLNSQLAERDALVKSLNKLQNIEKGKAKQASLTVKQRDKEIQRLQLLLTNKRNQVAKTAKVFDNRVVIFNKTHFTDSGSQRMLRLEQKKQAALQMEGEYLDTLKNLINSLRHSMRVSVYEDVTDEVINVYVSPKWRVPASMANMPFNGGREDKRYKHKDEYRSDGVLMTHRRIGSSPLSLLQLKYAIVHVINVNERTIEIPVLLPVSNSGIVKKPEHCAYSKNLKAGRKFKYLCFNFNFQPEAVKTESAIAFRQYLEKDSLSMVFPIDADIDVKSRFEIREIKSGKKVFTKTNG